MKHQSTVKALALTILVSASACFPANYWRAPEVHEMLKVRRVNAQHFDVVGSAYRIQVARCPLGEAGVETAWITGTEYLITSEAACPVTAIFPR